MSVAKSNEAIKQVTYLAAALKAPRITEAAARLADQARDVGWTQEDYLAAVLEREVSARTPPALGCGSARLGFLQSRPLWASTSMPNQRHANKSEPWPRGAS